MNEVERLKVLREFKKYKIALFQYFISSSHHYSYEKEIFKNLDLYIKYINKFYLNAELYFDVSTFHFYYDKEQIYIYRINNYNTCEENLLKKLKEIFYSENNTNKIYKFKPND